ncbi:DUF2591 domain-containing protein [Hafnia alvei]|uniref:phage protein NinX family protein n=1 Tax=Hafnia alvei TaxID=569 RepID=UPI001034838F|nr:phage protein NinX family protein [Hafnia alvei]TBL37680.1 DUF2591 domain-containing protein [Hafnia alvei]
MTDYSKMSDFDVTCMVAKFIHPDAELLDVNRGKTESSITLKFGPHGYMGFDPCNNPSDAWPIILNNRISMVWDCAEDSSSEWWNAVAQFDECSIQYQLNPLRAAMIVYLMMKESENG